MSYPSHSAGINITRSPDQSNQISPETWPFVNIVFAMLSRVFLLWITMRWLFVALTNLPDFCLPNLACLSVGHQYSSVPPACPVMWGRRNSHRWFFAIIFCHPPSFFPVPQFPSLFTASIHLVLGLPVFLFPCGFMSIICLQACSSGRLLTCPNHFNLLSVTLLDIFGTPHTPRMYSFLILSFCMLYHLRVLHVKYVS